MTSLMFWPKFLSERNERIAIRLIFLLFIILLIGSFAIYHLTKGNCSISFGRYLISKEVIIEQNESALNNVKEMFQRNIDSLKYELEFNSHLNEKLKDSILIMLEKRNDELLQCNKLLDELRNFKNKTGIEQEIIMKKIEIFLSRSSNPGIFIDFGIVAREMIYRFETNLLIADTILKAAQIQSLIDDMGSTRNDYQKLLRLYNRGAKTIQSNDAIIAKLREDSINFALQIEFLRNQNYEIKAQLETNSELIKKYAPIRIQNMDFFPPGCRSKKDRSFPLNCIKELELDFQFRSNKGDGEIEETFEILFTFPTGIGGQNKIWRVTKVAKSNENIKVIFKQEEGKYYSGMYIVQVFHNTATQTLPMEMDTLFVKKQF